MSKIVEYKIIEKSRIYELEERIEELLEDGRQPRGDLIYNRIRTPNGNYNENYIQCMIKYEDPKDEKKRTIWFTSNTEDKSIDNSQTMGLECKYLRGR